MDDGLVVAMAMNDVQRVSALRRLNSSLLKELAFTSSNREPLTPVRVLKMYNVPDPQQR